MPAAQGDVELFHGLAEQLDKAAALEDPREYSFDGDTISAVLRRLKALEKMPVHHLEATKWNLRDEMDKAIKSITEDGSSWDEEVRKKVYEVHVAALDTLLESGSYDPHSMGGTSSFLRMIVIGIESYRAHHHPNPRR